jgi:hypothetical protein
MKRILGQGCSMTFELVAKETVVTIRMSGKKESGKRTRTGKFDSAACEKLSKEFAELAELLKCAEVQHS